MSDLDANAESDGAEVSMQDHVAEALDAFLRLVRAGEYGLGDSFNSYEFAGGLEGCLNIVGIYSRWGTTGYPVRFLPPEYAALLN